MRGSKALAVAVRDPKGHIVIHTEPINASLYNGRISRTPFLRGLAMLWDSLGLGMRALMYSANVAAGEIGVEFKGPIAWGTTAVALIFALLALPAACRAGWRVCSSRPSGRGSAPSRKAWSGCCSSSATSG